VFYLSVYLKRPDYGDVSEKKITSREPNKQYTETAEQNEIKNMN